MSTSLLFNYYSVEFQMTGVAMVRQLSAQHSCHKETLSRVACNFLETTMFMFFSGLLFRLKFNYMITLEDIEWSCTSFSRVQDCHGFLILGTMKKTPQNICQQTNGRIERNIYGKPCVVPQIQGFPAHPCKDGNGNFHIFMVGRIKRAIKKINRHGLFTESMFNPKVIGFQVISICSFIF